MASCRKMQKDLHRQADSHVTDAVTMSKTESLLRRLDLG
jgi:hypothetical protein